MNDYLRNTFGIAGGANSVGAGRRNNLVTHGFPNLDTLHEEDDNYAKEVCNMIRKSQGTQPTAEHRITPVDIEKRLKKLVVFSRYLHATQRVATFDLATLDNLNQLSHWCEGLDRDPVDDVKTFSTSANIKRWMESFEALLEVKLSSVTKFPLVYITRTQEVPPPDGGV